jgi:hypothetical protein
MTDGLSGGKAVGAAFGAGWGIALWSIVIAGLAASICVYRWNLSPPLWVTLAIAVALRLTVVLISDGHVPYDVAISFQTVGRLVIERRDPLTFAVRYSWNFLPAMAYVFAAEMKTGLSWQLASKIVPVLADLATVVMMGYLAEPRRAETTRLLYALSPIALLVAAHHGQIEPVAIALGIGALLLARRGRPASAGIALGLAIATKTWPLVFTPGVLRDVPTRAWWRVVTPAAGVLAALFVSTRVFLHGSLHTSLTILTSYRSYFGTYGWSGLLHLFNNAGIGYAGPGIDSYQSMGTVVLVATIVGLTVLFRRLSGPDLTLVLILGFIAVTSGFGGQYLLWPVALIYARRLPRGWPYLISASIFAAFFYLVTLQVSAVTEFNTNVPIQIWMSLVVIAASLWAIPWNEASNPFHTGPLETRRRASAIPR